MPKGNEQNGNLSHEEWAKRFPSPQQTDNFSVLNNLYSVFNLNQNPNFNNTVPGTQYSQQNYSNQPVIHGGGRTSSWADNNYQATSYNPTPNIEGQSTNQFMFQPYPITPEVQKDTYQPTVPINNVTQSTQFGNQGVNQDSAPGSFNPYQDQGTPTNLEGQTGQNPQDADNLSYSSPQSNQEERFSESVVLPHEEVLRVALRKHEMETLEKVLELINVQTQIMQDDLKQNAEVDISKRTKSLSSDSKKLYNNSVELFTLYTVAGELIEKSEHKKEMTQKAEEQLKAIQNNPLYSREINNEQEKRDACERAGRFIGETTSRIVGLGLGFGAAVAVASLMIPPAMVLYGPMIVAGPVIAAGAGGAAAFMANKLGYKIADITLSNTTALAGHLLDSAKNGLRDWWNKDKEQVKALTTLKNQLLRDIATSQLAFIEAKNELHTAKDPGSKKSQELHDQMTAHLESLYINTSVLKDLETSIVEQRKVKAAQEKALEEWKKTSLLNKAAKKIGESDTWKSISETGPRNICEKLGIITGKIVGLAIAAGLGAAAAIAITSSIGAAATILYGPMAVVGITAAAGIAAGAVGYKIANPVATWSFKKVGQVADLAKNATYEVAKSMAVGTKNIVMGKGKHSDKEQAKKASGVMQEKS